MALLEETAAVADALHGNGLSGHFKTGQWWSGQNRPMEIARNKVFLSCVGLVRQVCFCPLAPRRPIFGRRPQFIEAEPAETTCRLARFGAF